MNYSSATRRTKKSANDDNNSNTTSVMSLKQARKLIEEDDIEDDEDAEEEDVDRLALVEASNFRKTVQSALMNHEQDDVVEDDDEDLHENHIRNQPHPQQQHRNVQSRPPASSTRTNAFPSSATPRKQIQQQVLGAKLSFRFNLR